jgi:hypothetical protein
VLVKRNDGGTAIKLSHSLFEVSGFEVSLYSVWLTSSEEEETEQFEDKHEGGWWFR